MLQLLLSLFLLAVTVRFAGESGTERFLALSERRAQAVREHFTSRLLGWIVIGGLAISVVDIGLAIYLRSWAYLAVAALALVAFGVVLVLRPRATAIVGAAYAERGLEPLVARESSARRDRRQKQLGLVFLVAYLAGRALDVLAEQTDASLPKALMGVTTLVVFVAGFALLWSTAWRFGDERPEGAGTG